MSTKRTKIKAPERLTYPNPWDDRPVSRACWEKHRDRMLQSCGNSDRPEEWWLYEKDMDFPRLFGDRQRILFEMGELREDEVAGLMEHWREAYDRLSDPGFVHHADNKILRGDAARRSFIRWAGIPPAILKQWDAEKAA